MFTFFALPLPSYMSELMQLIFRQAISEGVDDSVPSGHGDELHQLRLNDPDSVAFLKKKKSRMYAKLKVKWRFSAKPRLGIAMPESFFLAW